MKNKVTIIGSYVADLMARASHLPVPGETVKGSLFKIGPGGKGFNQCIAASKAGADVTFITKIGNDQFGRLALDLLRELSIDDRFVMISDREQTGIAMILVDENTQQNEIVVIPGACGKITEDDLNQFYSEIASSSFVVMQLEIEINVVEKIIQFCSERKNRIILNPAPYQGFNHGLLKYVSVITPNEVEAGQLSGININSVEDASRAAFRIHEMGVETVVITMGEVGVVVLDQGIITHLDAYKVSAVDSTGAGDSFTGALAASLSRGNEILAAVKYANAAAALSVLRLGTSVAMPDDLEIRRFMERHSI